MPFFHLLYVAILQRIEDMVPAIRYTDQDLGQLENYETRPPVSWPCLLLDFDAATYENLGRLHQSGRLQVVLRIGFAPFSSANSLSPDTVRDKALEYYNVENEVYKALQGWEPLGPAKEPLCQPLMRVQAATERRNDEYRVRTLVFATSYFDAEAADADTRVTFPLKIETVN